VRKFNIICNIPVWIISDIMIRLIAGNVVHCGVKAHQEQYLDKNDLRDNTTYKIVIDAQGDLTTIGAAAINASTPDKPVLVYFAISAECQGMGYGKAAMILLLKMYDGLSLKVNPNNVHAVRLYAGLGFVFLNDPDQNGEVTGVRKST